MKFLLLSLFGFATLAITLATELPSVRYVGCVYNTFAQPHPNDSVFESEGLTPRDCVTACYEQGYIVAGVQNSNTCYCSHTIDPSRLIESKDAPQHCNMPCAGDVHKLCGGFASADTYVLTDYVDISLPAAVQGDSFAAYKANAARKAVAKYTSLASSKPLAPLGVRDGSPDKLLAAIITIDPDSLASTNARLTHTSKGAEQSQWLKSLFSPSADASLAVASVFAAQANYFESHTMFSTPSANITTITATSTAHTAGRDSADADASTTGPSIDSITLRAYKPQPDSITPIIALPMPSAPSSVTATTSAVETVDTRVQRLLNQAEGVLAAAFAGAVCSAQVSAATVAGVTHGAADVVVVFGSLDAAVGIYSRNREKNQKHKIPGVDDGMPATTCSRFLGKSAADIFSGQTTFPIPLLPIQRHAALVNVVADSIRVSLLACSEDVVIPKLGRARVAVTRSGAVTLTIRTHLTADTGRVCANASDRQGKPLKTDLSAVQPLHTAAVDVKVNNLPPLADSALFLTALRAHEVLADTHTLFAALLRRARSIGDQHDAYTLVRHHGVTHAVPTITRSDALMAYCAAEGLNAQWNPRWICEDRPENIAEWVRMREISENLRWRRVWPGMVPVPPFLQRIGSAAAAQPLVLDGGSILVDSKGKPSSCGWMRSFHYLHYFHRTL